MRLSFLSTRSTGGAQFTSPTYPNDLPPSSRDKIIAEYVKRVSDIATNEPQSLRKVLVEEDGKLLESVYNERFGKQGADHAFRAISFGRSGLARARITQQAV